MTSRRLARIAAMDRAELQWRLGTTARTAAERIRTAVAPQRWRREQLARLLVDAPALSAVRRAAERRDWGAAHAALSAWFAEQPPRFVIAPALRTATAARIRTRLPESAGDAAARADRLCSGEYDLLGYRGLRFDDVRGEPAAADRASGTPDWQYDPVHRRRPPQVFWCDVPYLDAACGDHKIIWELNRHQHWLLLGRAYWLTDDPRYRARALAELASWITANPPLLGINWASMLELAFRSMSWVWAIQFFAERDGDERSPWLVDLLVAIDRQLEHVERNLSYYFSPNTHLLGEALALYVCSQALPMLRASARRAATGRAILLAEMHRQITPDGGHCERSTHYHRYALDFYLLALNVARISGDGAASGFERAVARLGFAARLLADDRGQLPHIGDDDGGATWPLTGRAVDDIRDSLAAAAAATGRADLKIGPTPEECYWLFAHADLAPSVDRTDGVSAGEPLASAALPDTGYYISRSPAGDHLIIDAGAHGYQNGGHAHADALSLTLSVRGLPILIDAGTACYTVDPGLRDRHRSTAAHNTLVVDERPQSVPAGPFHWAHTAHATAHRWRANAGFDFLEASHDGYRPLEHRRHVLVLHGDVIVVADLVAGDGAHRADVHWHIDPRWQVSLAGRRAVIACPGERLELMVTHGVMQTFTADPGTGLGWHAPVYGRPEPATTVRVSHTGSAPLWIVSVFGLNKTNEIADVETMPVWAEAGALAQSIAVRITRAHSVDTFAVVQSRGPRSWRVGELETDGHALFCRTDPRHQVTRVAMVDGSMVRAGGRRGFLLALPREAPDVHVDIARPPEDGHAAEARLSGPAFGARIEVAGRVAPIEMERRSTARVRAQRREVR